MAIDSYAICESCGKKHRVADEPAIVQQSGTYMCSECWGDEEEDEQ